MKRLAFVVVCALAVAGIAVAQSQYPSGGGGGGLAEDDVDACSELAAIWDDETGTCGGPVLSVSPSFTTSIHMGDDVECRYGNTNAAPDHWCNYDATNTQWECNSTNINGAGANGTWIVVDDGQRFVQIPGGVVVSTSAGAYPQIINSTPASNVANFVLSGGDGLGGGANAPALMVNDSAKVTASTTGASVTGTWRFDTMQTATVNGATTFAATSSYVDLQCTGAETINTITGGNLGQVLFLQNTDTECTIADDDEATASNAINLSGTATDSVGATAKMLILLHNGTHWQQFGGSTNN